VIFGNYEKLETLKRNRGESKAETGNRGSILASFSQNTPTSLRLPNNPRINHYWFKYPEEQDHFQPAGNDLHGKSSPSLTRSICLTQTLPFQDIVQNDDK